MRAAATAGAAVSPDPPDVTAYIPMVERVVRSIARGLPAHVAIDDLVGAGTVGLLEAARRYDAGQGDFARYAEFRVRGAILDELRRLDMMSKEGRRSQKRLEAVQSRLTAEGGTAPDDARVAEALGVAVDAYQTMRDRLVGVRVVSMEELPPGVADAVAAAGAADDPCASAEIRELRARLAEAIAELPGRRRVALSLHYDDGLALREVGYVLGVTESRACQLVGDAVQRLRARLLGEAPRR
jgi:RNA polymerase sigma factor for flagellar operon FliA